MNLGSSINTSGDDSGPYFSWDGTELYFYSSGHGGYGMRDLFVAMRSKIAGRP